jgi:hypothetical protein
VSGRRSPFTVRRAQNLRFVGYIAEANVVHGRVVSRNHTQSVIAILLAETYSTPGCARVERRTPNGERRPPAVNAGLRPAGYPNDFLKAARSSRNACNSDFKVFNSASSVSRRDLCGTDPPASAGADVEMSNSGSPESS